MRNQLWHDLHALNEAILSLRQIHSNASKTATGSKRTRHLQTAHAETNNLHELQDWLSALDATQQQAIDLSEAGNLRIDEPEPGPAQDWSDALLERVYQRL